jgi:hypothetical protein
MDSLEGEWRLERRAGLLPPLGWVRKRIRGDRGETRIGPFPGIPFRVEGLALRYVRPFSAFVDVLVPDGNGFLGCATFLGREYGRFALRRASEDWRSGAG